MGKKTRKKKGSARQQAKKAEAAAAVVASAAETPAAAAEAGSPTGTANGIENVPDDGMYGATYTFEEYVKVIIDCYQKGARNSSDKMSASQVRELLQEEGFFVASATTPEVFTTASGETMDEEGQIFFDAELADKVPSECEWCGMQGHLYCGNCLAAAYCSEACQRKAWIEHAYDCNAPDFSKLPQVRPRIRSLVEWEDQISEIKRTFYPEGDSYWMTIQNGNEYKAFAGFAESDFDRHTILFIPKRREKIRCYLLEQLVGVEELVANGTVAFGIELAWNVIPVWELFLRKFSCASNPKYKLDLLHGFTAVIFQYYGWMLHHPHNWEGHDILYQLGTLWKETMAEHSAQELGLDPVFSTAGIHLFLQKFKIAVEEETCGCTYGPLKFPYE